jgi:hypothetical protein
MRKRNAQQLRTTAQTYRDMCADGDDVRLKAALILLADEFEPEAEILETCQNDDGAMRCREI